MKKLIILLLALLLNSYINTMFLGSKYIGPGPITLVISPEQELAKSALGTYFCTQGSHEAKFEALKKFIKDKFNRSKELGFDNFDLYKEEIFQHIPLMLIVELLHLYAINKLDASTFFNSLSEKTKENIVHEIYLQIIYPNFFIRPYEYLPREEKENLNKSNLFKLAKFILKNNSGARISDKAIEYLELGKSRENLKKDFEILLNIIEN